MDTITVDSSANSMHTHTSLPQNSENTSELSGSVGFTDATGTYNVLLNNKQLSNAVLKRLQQAMFHTTHNLNTMALYTDTTAFTHISTSCRDSGSIEEPDSEPSEPQVEPTPDWNTAIDLWGIAWPIHIYSVAVVSLLITVYSFIVVVRLRNRKNLVSRGYFITLNIMLVLFGLLRTIYFFVDPYSRYCLLPVMVDYLLFNTGLPCLTTAFSIQLVSLLQALRIQTMSLKIQKKRVLVMIIASHFLLSILSDITVTTHPTSNILLILCQVFFIVWGLFLVVAYFYVFRKLYTSAKRRQKEMEHLALIHQNNAASKCPIRKPKLTMMLAIKTTCLTGIFGFLIIVMQIYSIFSVFSVLTKEPPEAWPWWIYHYLMRILELSMAITMAYVASQPMRYNTTDTTGNKNVFPSNISLPCFRFCVTKKEEDMTETEELQKSECDFKHQMETNNGKFNKHADYKIFPEGKYQQTLTVTSPHQQTTGVTEGETCVLANGGSGENGSFPADTHSMLVNEDGFIRFRQEGDPLHDPTTSTDDAKNSIHTGSDKNGRSNGVTVFPGNNFGKFSIDQCLDMSDGLDSQQNDSRHQVKDSNTINKVKRSTSVPNTRSNTPVGFLTSKSVCSNDFDGLSGFSYKPPSSIHLKESIDKALNFMHLQSDTESQELSDNLSAPKTPDSLGNSNPVFKYDQKVQSPRLPFSACMGPKYKVMSVNHSHPSKTDLLRQNLVEMRSSDASSCHGVKQ